VCAEIGATAAAESNSKLPTIVVRVIGPPPERTEAWCGAFVTAGWSVSSCLLALAQPTSSGRRHSGPAESSRAAFARFPSVFRPLTDDRIARRYAARALAPPRNQPVP